MKKIKKILIILIIVISLNNTKVLAGVNLKSEVTIDENTKNDKCPVTVTVQDNLKNEKNMDFSVLDCMFYKMDDKGNYVLDENGNKILKEEDEDISFSCLQTFLDKYTNEEFKEAANNVKAEGFPQNKYCPVYCVEQNEFKFPGYAPVTNSGGNFTWTIGRNNDKSIINGLSVRLHGVKACRSQVDLNAWTEDYIDIMEQLENYIDIKSPISNGTINCTPSAMEGAGANTYCAYSENPISTTYHLISSSDYNQFQNYHELNDLSGGGFTTHITEGLGIVATGNDVDNMLSSLNGQANSDSDSNRYYVTSVPSSIQEPLDGIISVWGNGQAAVYPASDFNGDYSSMESAILKYQGISNETPNAIIRVKVQVWERHCCTWEIDSETPRYWTDASSLWKTEDGIPTSITYGYQKISVDSGCGLQNGGLDIVAPGTYNGITCCGNTVSNGKSCCVNNGKCTNTPREYCSGPVGTWQNNFGGTHICPSDKQPKEYEKYQRYRVKCGTNGAGDNQQVVAGGSNIQCSSSSIRKCPSGYAYSPSTGMCYYADVEKIETALNKLLGLIKDLKQCHDQLIDYDYYLDTKMEIEYNETQDTVNNFYRPSKDKVTKTELKSVKENTAVLDGENKLGEYASEVVKPSKKSDFVKYVNFFGNTYSFSKNGIPLVACSVSGTIKTCTATNNTSLNDYWYDWYGRTYIAMYEYKLDGNFYKWVRLPEGVSQSTKPTGDYEKYNRYIDIGYANYPVHFSTPGNTYEGLNIKITNIGYKNYLYNTYQTQVRDYNKKLTDSDLVSTEANNELLHDCYYTVEDGEPYCPPKGCNVNDDLGSIRLIYRPISLSNPFPSIDADGRNTGSNWCTLNSEDDEKDCSNTNDSVEKYILNNRNTEADSVYSKEPMYQITLDPALIRRIRDYNKSTNYDDYNMYCSSEKTGKECRSHFVVGGMEETGLASLKDAFTGCGTDADFHACDKLDNIER